MIRFALVVLLGCGGAQSSTPVPQHAPEDIEPLDEPRLTPNRYRSIRAAAQVRWDMNSEAELSQGGWHYWGSGTSTFTNGILTTSANGYEEWMQRNDRGPSDWWRTIDNERGWAIETRMRVLRAAPDCGSLGMWIHDGARLLKVFFRDGSVGVSRANEWVQVDTRQWHEYRIEGRVDWIRLKVDGETVFEERSERMNTGPYGGTQALNFGDLGGCSGSDAEWDWFGYDTGPTLQDVECDYCAPTESFRIAQLRQRWAEAQGPAREVSGTADANEACLAFVALDHTAREIVVHLPMNDYAHMRDAMLQAPHVRNAATAAELARYVRRSLQQSGKPARMMRPEPVRREPDWVNPLVDGAERLSQHQYDAAWRRVSEIANSGLRSNELAQQASANLLSVLVNAAQGECR